MPPGGKKAQPSADQARKLRVDSWRALEKLYNQGKCKAVGVSNFLQRHLDDLSECEHPPMVNQSEFHPYYNNQEVFDLCKKMDIQFEVQD